MPTSSIRKGAFCLIKSTFYLNINLQNNTKIQIKKRSDELMTDKESLTHEIEDDLAARNRNWNKVSLAS